MAHISHNEGTMRFVSKGWTTAQMDVQLWIDMMVLLKSSNGRMSNYVVMLHKLMGARKFPGCECYSAK